MLRERLTRKEDLLRDYEKDLGKLRQAEILLREKDILLQDLEVIQFKKLKENKQRFFFVCRQINEQKMMKHYFFEILLKILKILSIKKNVLIHRLNLVEYEFIFI
jgi:hypothetical protein